MCECAHVVWLAWVQAVGFVPIRGWARSFCRVCLCVYVHRMQQAPGAAMMPLVSRCALPPTRHNDTHVQFHSFSELGWLAASWGWSCIVERRRHARLGCLVGVVFLALGVIYPCEMAGPRMSLVTLH